MEYSTWTEAEGPTWSFMLLASAGPIFGIAARADSSAAAMVSRVVYPALKSILALLLPTPLRDTSSDSSSLTPYLILTDSGRILVMASGLKM